MKYEKLTGMPIGEYRRTWFIGLPLRIKVFLSSYKLRKQYHIMQDVIYKGIPCFINNGTSHDENGNHLWDICEKKVNSFGERNCHTVYESELTRPFTWFNYKNSRLWFYKWFMKNWYSFGVRNKILKKYPETLKKAYFRKTEEQ